MPEPRSGSDYAGAPMRVLSSHGLVCRSVSYAAAATACAVLLGLPTATQAADAPNVLQDRFYVSLGSFILSTDTKVRLDGEDLEGTRFNWENTFGSGDVTRFRIDGTWRFADRHKLRFLWFNNSRSDSVTFDEDVEWGGEVFPVSAKVKGEFDFDVYELAYEYAFVRRPSYELSGTIGLHYTDLSLALSAKGTINNGELSGDIRKEASVGAPLPVLGLRGAWMLPHNFWIDASAQYFALSIDQYDGSLVDYKVVLAWQPKKWLGLGIGYNKFGVDVDVGKDKFDGSLDWSYSGPMIFYSAVF